MTDPTLSTDLAQATIVGRLMNHPDEAAGIFVRVRVEDLDRGYRYMARAIHQLRVEHKPHVALDVIAQLERTGDLDRAGGFAEVMRVNGFGFGDPESSIDLIVNVSRLRRLEALALRTHQQATETDADSHRIVGEVLEAAQQIRDGIEADGDITTPTAGEFVTGEDAPYDWVVPGLIERQDRLILTGTEGLGKSVLLRQIAVCAAAGVHPFNHRPVEPQRVLLIDCENGPTKIRRALRPLLTQARQHGDGADERMWVEAKPEGLDLTRPEDELWLVRHVDALQPALLVTGPVYRLHAQDPNAEEPARQVTRVLDRCRAVANCAVATEAHAGHGWGGQQRPVRPTGTSLWLRWPEFGYGLRQADGFDPHSRLVDFVAWRGDREERDWPAQLRTGGTWPWQAVESQWAPSGFERGTAS